MVEKQGLTDSIVNILYFPHLFVEEACSCWIFYRDSGSVKHHAEDHPLHIDIPCGDSMFFHTTPCRAVCSEPSGRLLPSRFRFHQLFRQ
jgi:hypothetical protein